MNLPRRARIRRPTRPPRSLTSEEVKRKLSAMRARLSAQQARGDSIKLLAEPLGVWLDRLEKGVKDNTPVPDSVRVQLDVIDLHLSANALLQTAQIQ